MKKLLKKSLAIILVSTLLLTALLITASAETSAEGTAFPEPVYTMNATIGAKWYFGNDRNTPFTRQGHNGFYAMYSTDVNQGKNFPVEDAKLCEYDSSDYYWKIPNGSGGFVNNFKIASSEAGYGSSNVFTKAVHLATGYSAVIKWVAPKGGEYFVEQWWRGDDGGIFTANNDGVIVAIYKGTENIFYHDETNKVSGQTSQITTFEKTKADGLVTLNAGDALYFVSDPKDTGYSNSWTKDAPWTQISIEYRGNTKKSTASSTATYSSTNLGTTYSFGANSDSTVNGQGGNGFYAMYSMAVNKGDKFPLDSLYYCKPTGDQNYLGIPLWQQDANGNTIYVSNFQIGSGGHFNNANNKSAIRLANGYSAVIKWVAPRTGDYSVKAQWKGDGYGRITVNNDGTTVGVYTDEKNLYSMSTVDRVTGSDGVIPTYNSDGTVFLKAGQALYFVADPETIGYNSSTVYDSPFVDIDITFESLLKGDVKTDEVVDVTDLVRLKKLIANEIANQNEYADINSDELYNSNDLTALRKILLGL